MDLYFHITSSNNLVIISNLPAKYTFDKDSILNRIEKTQCKTTNKPIRHGCFQFKTMFIYIVSYDESTTRKVLQKYFDSCRFFLEHFINLEDDVKKTENQNFRRLKHNLVTHNTNIIQELEKQFPIDVEVKGANKQIDIIKQILNTNLDNSAVSILRIIKSANLMKSDFDVYDMLSSPNPYLEFDYHNIFKVINLILNPFWLEFVQKEVEIEIYECRETVLIDYKSISVVLSHIFDNMSKYIAPKTTIEISFNKNQTTLDIILEMTSLKIVANEVDKIFDENYSGEYAKKIGKSGDGIGMHVVKKLVELNKGKISITPNIDRFKSTVIHGIPFERNRITLTLNK